VDNLNYEAKFRKDDFVNFEEKSIKMHEEKRGKIEVVSKEELDSELKREKYYRNQISLELTKIADKNGATVDLGGAASTAGTNAAISTSTATALQQLIDANSDLAGNFKVTAAGAGAITIEALKDGEFAGSKGNIQWNAGTAAQFTVNADTDIHLLHRLSVSTYEIKSGYKENRSKFNCRTDYFTLLSH